MVRTLFGKLPSLKGSNARERAGGLVKVSSIQVLIEEAHPEPELRKKTSSVVSPLKKLNFD